jgi:hypothetical protein
MKAIVNNFLRMIWDDGRCDRDFSEQEKRLQEAQKYLREATDGLTKAASILSDLIKLRS